MLKELNNQCRALVTKAGVDLKPFPEEVFDKAKKKSLWAAHDWCEAFLKGPGAKFASAYALVPEAIWANYRLYNIKGLREQAILKEAKDELLAAWVTRPPILRRKVLSGSDASPGVSDDGDPSKQVAAIKP